MLICNNAWKLQNIINSLSDFHWSWCVIKSIVVVRSHYEALKLLRICYEYIIVLIVTYFIKTCMTSVGGKNQWNRYCLVIISLYQFCKKTIWIYIKTQVYRRENSSWNTRDWRFLLQSHRVTTEKTRISMLSYSTQKV